MRARVCVCVHTCIRVCARAPARACEGVGDRPDPLCLHVTDTLLGGRPPSADPRRPPPSLPHTSGGHHPGTLTHRAARWRTHAARPHGAQIWQTRLTGGGCARALDRPTTQLQRVFTRNPKWKLSNLSKFVPSLHGRLSTLREPQPGGGAGMHMAAGLPTGPAMP